MEEKDRREDEEEREERDEKEQQQEEEQAWTEGRVDPQEQAEVDDGQDEQQEDREEHVVTTPQRKGEVQDLFTTAAQVLEIRRDSFREAEVEVMGTTTHECMMPRASPTGAVTAGTLSQRAADGIFASCMDLLSRAEVGFMLGNCEFFFCVRSDKPFRCAPAGDTSAHFTAAAEAALRPELGPKNLFVRPDRQKMIKASRVSFDRHAFWGVGFAANGAPSPLLMAAQCRHPAAVAALCEHGARVTPEVLEEVKLISQESRRVRIDEILRPQVQGDPNMKLPLWVWVQAGSLPAVEALLRNAAHDEAVGADVFIALHRSRGDEETRRGMAERLREHVGEARLRHLQTSAATRMLMLELRQAHDEERDVEVSTVREALALGADAAAREEGHEDEEEAEGGGYGLTALDLVAMNRRSSADSVRSTIEVLLEARADVNAETEAVTPLLAALHHCHVAAVEALCKGPVKFTGEILDE
ncbi:unnamed protein product, partial [Prorocentrum cordatum]